MINIKTILTAVVDMWRATPGVLAAMGGDPNTILSRFTSRPGSPSYDAESLKAHWPSIVVSHVSTALGFRGQFTHWRHTIRADIRLMEDDQYDYATLIDSLINEVPINNNGLTVMQCSFLEGVDPMEDVSFIIDTDLDGKDFYRMEFALQEQT